MNDNIDELIEREQNTHIQDSVVQESSIWGENF